MAAVEATERQLLDGKKRGLDANQNQRIGSDTVFSLSLSRARARAWCISNVQRRYSENSWKCVGILRRPRAPLRARISLDVGRFLRPAAAIIRSYLQFNEAINRARARDLHRPFDRPLGLSSGYARSKRDLRCHLSRDE